MRSPRRLMCASVLAFEGIVLALMTPVLVTVAGLSTQAALVIGLGLAASAFLIAGTLRWQWVYYAGFALQAAALAVGVVLPAMIVLAIVFGGLWITAYVLGRRIEAQQAAWAATPADPPSA